MLNFKIVCENSGSFIEFTEEAIKDEKFFLKMMKDFYERERKNKDES